MNRIIFLEVLLFLTFRRVAGECVKYSPIDSNSIWIKCPNLEQPAVTIDLLYDKHLYIDCLNETYDLSSVDTDIGEIEDVRIYKCNLPNILPIIFTKWNVTQVKYLRIIDFTQDEFVLNKKQLENIDVLVIKHKKHKNHRIADIGGSNDIEDFADLSKVTYENFFISLTNLEVLELSMDKIENLGENLLNPLSKLRQISLNANKVTEIPENLFKTNKLLEDIRLGYLNFPSIPENLFKGMDKLQKLQLNETGLQSLKERTFADLANLETLMLVNNRLFELPGNIFANTTNLKKLNLSGNQLSQWTKEYSNSLKNLELLDLGGNNLSKIVADSFAMLTNLRYLGLSKNNITEIEIQTFSPLKHLQKLDLSYNKLTYRDDNDRTFLRELLNVQTLILHHNNFRQFPTFTSISWAETLQPWSGHLETLDLSYNEIQQIQVNDLLSFDTVLLEGNKIEFIDMHLAQITTQIKLKEIKQTTINIDKNPLNCDCRVFDLLKFFNKRYGKNLTTAVKLQGEIICNGPAARHGQNIRNLPIENFTCDGINNYTCPNKCQCYISPYKKALIVNCTNSELEVPPQLSPVTKYWIGSYTIDKLIIDLKNNSLTNFLENRDATTYVNVSELYLSHNDLRVIDWLPRNLNILELNDNRLVKLGYKAVSSLNSSAKLERLTLEHNAWKCNCQLANLTKMIKTQYQNIPQKNLILCEDGRQLTDLTQGILCYYEDQILLIVLCPLLVIFLIFIGALLILYYKYEYHVKVWLYSKPFFKYFVTEADFDKDKLYDAFLSYSHKDEDFIVEHLMPELENGPERYKLCVHTRDWIVGEFISKQIINSVEDSRRTIIVLSEHFMESEWATMEFRTAHVQAMREGRHRLIVILYDDIDPKSIEDEELRAYLTTNTFVKWGDPWFWKKLKYVMPHRRGATIHRKFKSRKMENIMVTIDKMDLINSPATPNIGTPPAVSVDPLLLKNSNSNLNFKPSTTTETSPADSGLITSVTN